MSDELWLRELAQVNREQQEDDQGRLDERWDRLSRGELSPDEDAELRALAETSEDARAAYEGFRPLGPEFHASVVQAVRAQGLAPEAQPGEAPARLLPFRRRRLAGWSAVAAVAAAASVAILLRPFAPLPDYSLEISGGTRAWRGGEPEPAEGSVLASGDRFTVIVRPATEVSRGSKLDALCVLVRDREVRPLEVQSEIYPEGLVRMKGSLSRDLPPGTWTLWAIVGRPGELPDPAALPALSAGAREQDWVAVERKILVRPREPDGAGPDGLEGSVEN
jgi:hypothetical protein